MRGRKLGALGALAAAALTAAGLAGMFTRSSSAAPTASPSCQLGNKGGQIKHVMYFVFDNTHLRQDRPNVASDLQQMPHLMSFLTGSGTLITQNHTILISHTAGGIVSAQTGLYPDRNGQTVSNSYDYYKSNGLPAFTSSFKYWTDTVAGAENPLPNMITDGQQTTPAPWLTYTHAGCNFGGVSAANIELENTSTAPAGDITRVFGAGSPESTEASTNPTKAQADFVGIAIHCALGSALCNTANAKPDDATITPGSSNGYLALFGAKYVNPAITPDRNPCVNNTEGAPITDGKGNCGFPGFDQALAKNTLAEVAQMHEAGVQITYAYISDAHDNHTLSRASGPGEADYKAQLAAYDTAFGAFFQRLALDGINKSNTLFVFTSDEGDHFAGGTGTPQPDGSLAYSHTACSQAPVASPCPANQIGEVNAKIGALLPAGEPGFDIHFDDAPTFYVNSTPGSNSPSPTDPLVRKLERDISTATAPDPYAGGNVHIAQKLADVVEEKTLHMINSDPSRTPTFTLFGNPDFFFQTTNLSGACAGSTVCVNPGFAWNHGNVQEEIGNTWLGIVGPGVQNRGIDSSTWTDHTDERPTMLALLGLADHYQDDGRVITEVLTDQAISKALRQNKHTTAELGAVWKQVNAPFGQFATDTLAASTKAIAGDDATYTRIEASIAHLTEQRDALVAEIRAALNAAAFSNQQLKEKDAKDWTSRANDLLAQAHALAGS
jgi:arylsulfatase A-like enzyme